MSNYSIYQIYYDEATRLSNDSGFLQLDNSFNERPDWSEYWPIRNYFKNNILEDNKYYGFFHLNLIPKHFYYQMMLLI